MFFPDLKASGEESKVPLWRDEHGTTSNTASQAKEEGRQDGLRTPRPEAEQHLSGKGPSFALSGLTCTAFSHSIPSLPSLYVFAVRCCD